MPKLKDKLNPLAILHLERYSTKTKVLALIGICVLLTVLLFVFLLRDLPSPTKLAGSNQPQSTNIYDRNGTLLYSFYEGRDQTYIPLSQIPKIAQEATISIEDREFYHHGAIDIRGIGRAIVSIILHHRIEGGSTITQQLVKNSLLSSEQTITRKVKEAILSFATEILYPKDKILELYLNEIPYGGTVYGIEAASETFFGKHAKDLTLAQAALLAGLPESPTQLSPFGAHPELAKQRQLLVLQAMQEEGYITKAQQASAAAEPLQYKDISKAIQAPHFVFYVKDYLDNKYGEKMVEQGGLNVTTSLDLNIQDFAQTTVASEIAKLKGYHVTNGAALVTRPGTGEVLAMVGSKDYFDQDIDGNVNLTTSRRQPGSSIKPINYAVGLMKGYTAATPFVDEPICFPGGPDGKQYCPMNYDFGWHGVQPMRYALGNSFNIPAVKMLELNGIDSMLATASAMGITTLTDANRYGLALTLGSGEVMMTDMNTAYGVFANSGYRIDLHPVLKITDRNGKVLESYTPPPSPIFGKQVLPSGVTFIISSMLSDNGARLIDFGSNSSLVVKGHTVAAKTGTTNDFKDNWTFGYTKDFVVGTWVGNNDDTPMGSIASGITGAAPIWNKIFTYLLQDKPNEPFVQPPSVIQKSICALSGLLPDPANPCQTRFEYFIKGTEPTKIEQLKQNVAIDTTTNDLAKPGQTVNVQMKDESVLTDPTGDKYCLSCPHPTPSPTPGQ